MFGDVQEDAAKNLRRYSDQSFAPGSGQRVLELAEAKLAQSPLYAAGQKHLVYIGKARWRQRLFFAHQYGGGGVNYYPFTTNVFLRTFTVQLIPSPS